MHHDPEPLLMSLIDLGLSLSSLSIHHSPRLQDSIRLAFKDFMLAVGEILSYSCDLSLRIR
jgi:hypothetical protein